MSAVQNKEILEEVTLTQGSLTRNTEIAVTASSITAGVVLSWLAISRDFPPSASTMAFMAFSGFIAYLIAIYVVSRKIEGSRRALDRVVTGLVVGAFVLALMPLISVSWTVVSKGIARFDGDFFTTTMRNVVGEGGGAKHAVIGTLIITALSTLISVPIGLMVSVYLVEYGGNSWLARGVTLLVDVMTGIPSIVAGLFAAGVFTVLAGPGTKNGFAGAVALSVLMIPVVIRSSEEMLRLVPNELREASYGLGVPKWRTITKVVIPTAIAGILTGVTLSIARVIGETAPLLIAVGTTDSLNLNPFSGRMATLPILAYYQYQQPGVPPAPAYERSWAASLTLMLIVMFLFGLARVLSNVLKPKGLK